METKFLDKLLKINVFSRTIFFLILLPIPSKIEILYYKNILNQYINIINSKKISKTKKGKQIIYLTLYIFLYPFEYIYMRIFRIQSLILNVRSPKFISEINY